MTDRAKNPVTSVKHALSILEALLALGEGTVSDVTDRVDLSKGSVHSHLSTLCEAGYVKKNGQRYTVGLGWLTFGGHARDQLDIYRLGRPVVDELAAQTGELALLTTEVLGKSLYVYQRSGSRAVTTDSYTGIRLPLHCTGTGKAILSQLPENRVTAIIDQHGLKRFTENTIVDEEELRQELKTVREQGFALDDEERISGMRGIGVPVVDQKSAEPLGALSITGPAHRITGEYFRTELPDLLSKSTREIEINVTYS